MKVLAGLAVAVSADFDQVTAQWAQPKPNPFPANPNAPYCGCQILIDPAQYGGYINSTCNIKFPYAERENYGWTDDQDPHFVSVASSYIVGRERDDNAGDFFLFTGFDEVSNADVLDVLVFYDQDDCYRKGFDPNNLPSEITEDQSRIWELYNLTTAQTEALCQVQLECDPNGEALSGVFLGNFNYDIARSVQTYTVPIYGLEKGKKVDFDLQSYEYEDLNCANSAAHAGHGTVTDDSCSKYNNFTGESVCDNVITFQHDQDHNGLLEYFSFEPVGPLNAPGCWNPEEHDPFKPYRWQTPSPWDTMEECWQEGSCSYGGDNI